MIHTLVADNKVGLNYEIATPMFLGFTYVSEFCRYHSNLRATHFRLCLQTRIPKGDEPAKGQDPESSETRTGRGSSLNVRRDVAVRKESLNSASFERTRNKLELDS